jgi:hypothetical protein
VVGWPDADADGNRRQATIRQSDPGVPVASARWRERERVVSVFRVTSKAETGISGESKDVCLAAASEKLARYQDALDILVRLSLPSFLLYLLCAL